MSELPYIIFGSPSIGEKEMAAVTEVLRTCWLGTGPRVQDFQRDFAAYTRANRAMAVGSCTAALHLAMVASGVGPGDEVITTPLTFAATANAILHTGAKPVFVDVDRNTQNIDPTRIEAAITPRTKALLPVHFAGRPCQMDAIERIAARHNKGLLVIEDAAHAIEAVYKGRKIGSISPLTCFSFYVTKNMTTAEGGMVTASSDELADRIRVLALHGLSADAWSRFSDQGYKHYEVISPGYKYNMTDIQAAIGLCQLKEVDSWLVRRNELWARYDAAFANLPCVLPAPQEPETVHARHLYTLMIDGAALGRDEFMTEMHKKRIGTGVHYRSLHLHRYYAETFGYRPEDFPNAAWISDRTVSIPLSAKLTDTEVDYIIKSVQELLGRPKR